MSRSFREYHIKLTDRRNVQLTSEWGWFVDLETAIPYQPDMYFAKKMKPELKSESKSKPKPEEQLKSNDVSMMFDMEVDVKEDKVYLHMLANLVGVIIVAACFYVTVDLVR
jgi:hypothetical protein